MPNNTIVRRKSRSARASSPRSDPQPSCTHTTTSQAHSGLSATGRKETRRRWLCWSEHAQARQQEVRQGWRKKKNCSRQERQGRSVEDFQRQRKGQEIESLSEGDCHTSIPMSNLTSLCSRTPCTMLIQQQYTDFSQWLVNQISGSHCDISQETPYV